VPFFPSLLTLILSAYSANLRNQQMRKHQLRAGPPNPQPLFKSPHARALLSSTDHHSSSYLCPYAHPLTSSSTVLAPRVVLQCLLHPISPPLTHTPLQVYRPCRVPASPCLLAAPHSCLKNVHATPSSFLMLALPTRTPLQEFYQGPTITVLCAHPPLLPSPTHSPLQEFYQGPNITVLFDHPRTCV
jgi:hypothetical protein